MPRSATLKPETVTGWRFWYVAARFSTDALLMSPYCDKRVVPWLDRSHRAICERNRRHKPPVADCTCGVYADMHVLDTMARARELQLFTELRSSVAIDGSEPPFAVAGRVALTQAVKYRSLVRPDAVEWREWRAASGEIESLYILDDAQRRHQQTQRLAWYLNRRYGVPVTGGDVPYSAEDWDTRPRPDVVDYEKWRLYPPGAVSAVHGENPFLRHIPPSKRPVSYR